MEKILECFPQKYVISLRLKKEDVNILDDMGVSKLSPNFHFESELLL